MLCSNLKDERSKGQNSKNEGERKEKPLEKQVSPVTPKMLIKALKTLKKNAFKGLFFSPQEVTFEILKRDPHVERNLQVLYLEVSDKLACAAAAGLIGIKQDAGYFPLDFRQKGVCADSKSELMFWILYKRVLNRRAQEEKNHKEDRENESQNENKKLSQSRDK